MSDARLLVFGDSVTWGQGLPPREKFSTQVAKALGIKPEETAMLAHSGAVIGIHGAPEPQPPVHGEVPRGFPTILEQVSAFPAPDTVTHIIINGGINDTDVKNILNPLTSVTKLKHQVKSHCHVDMGSLLQAVLQRYRHRELRVVVTGYYPILSEESLSTDHSVDLACRFLQQRGVGVPFLPGLVLPSVPTQISEEFGERFVFLRKTVTLCRTFWKESAHWLAQAVRETNAAAGKSRIAFADPGFSESNAALASDPWLWGVNFDPEMSPMDPVAAERRQFCRTDEPDPIRRFACERASAGHPNVAGARRYADAILRHWQ